jgi:Protein of unknown function (DUF3667)
MSGEFEAAGTAIEGALLGAAVERASRAGSLDENGESDTVCLNCGGRLSGPFCSACGQKAHVHRTLSAIGHDVLHSVFHFDGKLWRTLPMLLFKPGELTRRYVHGERAKFVSPMGLFLFAIFMMFAVFSFTGQSGTPNIPADWQKEMRATAKRLDSDIPKLEAQLKVAPAGSPTAKTIAAKLSDMRSERNGIGLATDGKVVFEDEGERTPFGNGESLSFVKVDTGWVWFDHKLNDGGRKMVSNPGLALYKLQSNGYKFAWLLIPLSLPFVWLVTLGVRGHRFYDHAVFTTYSISFMCILFIIGSLLGWSGIASDWLVPIFAIAPVLHIYKQLRGAYRLSRFGTLVRMIPLSLSIVFVMTFFLIILLMLGLTG